MKDIQDKDFATKLLERLDSRSFWELLSKTSKIQIPIIQRDFAQGRNNEKTNEIRALFLKNIIETVESEKKLLELDFVYGSVENDVFLPLDGQQRLTTLFLFHWYIALRTGELQNNKNHFLKFTYETRISSREFCYELVENGEFLGVGRTLSEKICDSKWFFMSWKKDPTIKSVLVMLDAIEERLQSKNSEELKNFWKKLTSENPPIIFHFKQLNDIGLTDDLYIKMNARGKGLTDFENYKASFEKHIEDNKWEVTVENPTNTFSHKIDTVWTDLFWKHRGEDNAIDKEMMKFIAGIAINFYAQRMDIFDNSEEELYISKILKEKKDINITVEAVKRERIERRITFLFNNPASVIPEDFNTKDSFEYLKNCLNIYSRNKFDELLPSNLLLWDFVENKKVKINSNTEIDNNLFVEFVKDSQTEYKQRILFYAQTNYILNLETFNSELFSEWMRVVRNVVQNSTIDSAPSFIGAIGLISELSRGCKNIYEFLSNAKIISGFATKQIEEEILKASLLTNSNYKNTIFDVEDTNFCKGKIKFPLYCVGFNRRDDVFDVQSLDDIHKVICIYLNDSILSNDFRRGLLTIGNNRFFDYWATSKVYALDEAPKRCLIEDISDLKNYAYNLEFRHYLKDLMNQLTKKELSTLLLDYIPLSNTPNWTTRLIKESKLLDYSIKHFIAIDKENLCCYLLPAQKVANSKEGANSCKCVK